MKRSEVPIYMRGPVVTRNRKQFLLEDFDKEITHSVAAHKDFIGFRPVSRNHLLLIGQSDTSVEPDKKYETSIYIADHASILICGKTKGDLEIRIQSDEYPTKLVIDESERKFLRE